MNTAQVQYTIDPHEGSPRLRPETRIEKFATWDQAQARIAKLKEDGYVSSIFCQFLRPIVSINDTVQK